MSQSSPARSAGGRSGARGSASRGSGVRSGGVRPSGARAAASRGPGREQRKVSHSAYRNGAPGIASVPVPSASARSRSSQVAFPTQGGLPAQGSFPRANQQRSQASAPAQGDPLRSVSVSQVRSNARRARQQEPKKPRFGMGVIFIVIAVVLAIIAAGAFFLMSRSDLFPVSRITVTGVRHLTQQETAQLAAVPEGTTLVNVDVAGIEGRLKSNPWVLSATVERQPPDTINLNITERQIVAVVDVIIDGNDNQQTWALASDGTWLMQIPDHNSPAGQSLAPQIYEDVDAALHIQSVPYGSVPEAGKQCSSANITNALAIIDGMSTELADQVKSVSAASSDSTVLTLKNGIEIAFGDSSDIRDKERVCLELMEKYPNKIAYINVRTVNKPIWRAI